MRFGLFTAAVLACAIAAFWLTAPASALPAATALGQTAGVVDAASAKLVEDAHYHRRYHPYRYGYYRRYHRPYYRKRHYYRHHYRRHHRPYYRKRYHYRKYHKYY